MNANLAIRKDPGGKCGEDDQKSKNSSGVKILSQTHKLLPYKSEEKTVHNLQTTPRYFFIFCYLFNLLLQQWWWSALTNQQPGEAQEI